MQQVSIYDDQGEIYTLYYYPEMKSDLAIKKWSQDFAIHDKRPFYARRMLIHSVVHKEDIEKLLFLEDPELMDIYFNWLGADTDNTHIFNPVRMPRLGGK